MKKLSALCIALLLAGCGDSGGNVGFFQGGGNNPTPPPAEAADAFYTRVLGLIGTANDVDDPIPLDDVVTSPENTDPVTLG